MHLKLKGQELKTVLFMYRLLYQNLVVTANWKSLIDTEKEIQTLKLVIRSQEKKGEGRKNTCKNKFKAINKMTPRMYILIITLNVNVVSAPTRIYRLAEK